MTSLFLKVLVVGFTLFAPSLWAKSIMFQVSIAEKWFQTVKKYDDKEKQDFILGLLLHNIEEPTSGRKIFTDVDEEVTLQNIYEESAAFEAGFSFYSFVRKIKKKHAVRHNIYDHMAGIEEKHLSYFLDLLEDELVYDPKVCAKAASYLSKISIGEIVTGIPIEDIAVWHGVLYKYLSLRPSDSLHEIRSWELSEDSMPILKAALVYLSTKNPIRVHLEDLSLAFETAFEIFKLKHLQT